MGKKYRPTVIDFQSLPIEQQAKILATHHGPKIKCSRCQREIADNSNYCPYCGKKPYESED